MKIIISPAKKMNTDTDSLPVQGLPQFLPQTEKLLAALKAMDYAQLKNLWNCNDKIAQQNVERLERANLEKQLTPAILAYEGIQYQYMAPGGHAIDLAQFYVWVYNTELLQSVLPCSLLNQKRSEPFVSITRRTALSRIASISSSEY